MAVVKVDCLRVHEIRPDLGPDLPGSALVRTQEGRGRGEGRGELVSVAEQVRARAEVASQPEPSRLPCRRFVSRARRHVQPRQRARCGRRPSATVLHTREHAAARHRRIMRSSRTRRATIRCRTCRDGGDNESQVPGEVIAAVVLLAGWASGCSSGSPCTSDADCSLTRPLAPRFATAARVTAPEGSRATRPARRTATAPPAPCSYRCTPHANGGHPSDGDCASGLCARSDANGTCGPQAGWE